MNITIFRIEFLYSFNIIINRLKPDRNLLKLTNVDNINVLFTNYIIVTSFLEIFL